jgi:hypothetical protein
MKKIMRFPPGRNLLATFTVIGALAVIIIG